LSHAAACPHYDAIDGKYLKSDGTDLACAGTFTVAFANKEEGSGDTPCVDVRGEKPMGSTGQGSSRGRPKGRPPDILSPLPAIPAAFLPYVHK